MHVYIFLFVNWLLSVSLALADSSDHPTQELHIRDRYKEELRQQVGTKSQPLVVDLKRCDRNLTLKLWTDRGEQAKEGRAERTNEDWGRKGRKKAGGRKSNITAEIWRGTNEAKEGWDEFISLMKSTLSLLPPHSWEAFLTVQMMNSFLFSLQHELKEQSWIHKPKTHQREVNETEQTVPESARVVSAPHCPPVPAEVPQQQGKTVLSYRSAILHIKQIPCQH